jgi:hypothetical protein
MTFLYPPMLNLCGIVVANLKMATGRIFRCQESIRDIIIYSHMKWCWNRTIMNLCGIVVAIFMATTIPQKFNIVRYHQITKFDMWVDNDVPNWFPTLKNFYRSPFWKWPPQYRINSLLSDFNSRQASSQGKMSYIVLCFTKSGIQPMIFHTRGKQAQREQDMIII